MRKCDHSRQASHGVEHYVTQSAVDKEHHEADHPGCCLQLIAHARNEFARKTPSDVCISCATGFVRFFSLAQRIVS